MISGKWLGILFLLGGGVMAWKDISFGQQVITIARYGAEGTAITPVPSSYSCRSGVRSLSDSLDLTPSCSLSLSYVDANGQKQTAGRHQTYRATIEKLQRGETVRVKYLPANPQKALITGDASVGRMGIRWLFSIGVILLGICIYQLCPEEKPSNNF